jgi:hypothetical protein
MKPLAIASYAITAMGILVLTAAIAAGLSAVWVLGGLLLVIAGAVKIAVVVIWQRIAGL